MATYANLSDRTARRRQLKRAGFDVSKSFASGIVRVGCSQCRAAVINGRACHETGCPNIRRARR